jgi:hypothetical protein
LDQNAQDESIGYGEMNFEYEFNDGRPSTTNDFDDEEENPTLLWENNCGATQKTCAGYEYFGGHGECARGHSVWRTF